MIEVGGTYPCPACGATATLTADCPGCGRAPNPDAQRVVQLNDALVELAVAERSARAVHRVAYQRLTDAQAERNAAAARVRATLAGAVASPVPVGASMPAVPPPLLPTPPGERIREVEPRTVQNLLFVLGGVLLGTAAVVFAAVAWVTFSTNGRAAILGAFTVLLLALPVVANRRRLRATAETFAALALLFLVLDGYAAWYVDLFALRGSVEPTTFAAAVFAVTAAGSLGYWALTRLTAPAIAALAAAQPVGPLLVAQYDFGVTRWAAILLAMAGLNVLLLLAIRARRRAGIVSIVIGVWLAAGLLALLLATVTVTATPDRHWLIAVFALAAAVAYGWTWITGVARPIGAAFAVAFVEIGLVRDALLADEDYAYLLAATVIAVLAIALTVARARIQSSQLTAAWSVGLGGAGLAGVAVAGVTLASGASSVYRALPWWHADRGAEHWFTGQLPLVAVIIGGTLIVIARGGWRWIAAALTAASAALVLPESADLRWWVPIAVGLAVSAAVLGAAVRGPELTSVQRGLLGPIAGGVAMVTFLAAMGRPEGTLIGALSLIAFGGLAAFVGRTSAGPVVAGALAVAAVAAPFAGAALLRVIRPDAPDQQWLRAAAGAAGLAAIVVAARAIPYRRVVVGAEVVVLLGVSLLAEVGYFGEPRGIYPAAAMLVILALTTATGWPTAGWAAAVPALTTVVAVAPALESVLLRPYDWVTHIWTGAPDGVGLARVSAGWTGRPADYVPLGILALAGLAVGAIRRDLGLAVGAAWFPAALATLTGLAAAGAHWPTVATVSLGIGLAAAIVVTLRAQSEGSTWLGLFAAVTVAAPGLAGALPTRPTTLVGLGLIAVVGVVVAGLAPAIGVRMVGSLGAGAALLTFGGAVPAAADAPAHRAALGVLAAAAVLLFGAAWNRFGPESSVVVTLAAQMGALVALVLAVPHYGYAAVVAMAWGVVVALRSLLRGATARVALVIAAGCELLAWWLLLVNRGIGTLEAYTLPLALAALGAGWLLGRGRPAWTSWQRYGVALWTGFAPSLALLAIQHADPARRFLLGLVALAVFALGAATKQRAFFVFGAAVVIVVALNEVVLLWDRIPRWIPLGAAGALVLAAAISYEWSRNKVRQLRNEVGDMS